MNNQRVEENYLCGCSYIGRHIGHLTTFYMMNNMQLIIRKLEWLDSITFQVFQEF